MPIKIINLPEKLNYPVRITEVHVSTGQIVSKGDPIYSLEASDQKRGILRAPISGQIADMANVELFTAPAFIVGLSTDITEDRVDASPTPGKQERVSGKFAAKAVKLLLFLSLITGSAIGGYAIYQLWNRSSNLQAENASVVTMLCEGGPQTVESFDENGDYEKHGYLKGGTYLVKIQKNAEFRPFYTFERLNGNGPSGNKCQNPENCSHESIDGKIVYELVHTNLATDMTGQSFDVPDEVTFVELALPEGTMIRQTIGYRVYDGNYLKTIVLDQRKLDAFEGLTPYSRKTQILNCLPRSE